MTISLGDLVWWIRGKSDKLPGDLKQSEGQIKTFGQNVSTTLKDQMNMAVGMFMSQGMMQLSNALKSFTKDLIDSTVEYSNQMQDLSRITGMTLEDASRLYNVADDLRIGYGDLSSAMKLYANYLQTSGSYEEASIENLAKMADAYVALAPGMERTAWLQDRFGRGGAELGKLLEIGSQGILDMAAAVDENLIITKETVTATEKYRTAVDDLSDAFLGVKIEVFDILWPYLEKFTIWLKTDGIEALKNFINWFAALPGWAQAASVGLAGLVVALTSLSPMIIAIWGIVSVMGPVISGIGSFITSISTGLTALAATLGISLGWVLGLIAAVGLLIYIVKTLGPEAANTLKMYWKILQTLAANLARAVSGWFRNVGTAIMLGIGQGISAGWSWLVSLVQQVAQKLLEGAKKALGIKSPSAAFAEQVGKPSMEGIGEGFRRNLQKVVMNMQADVQMLPAGALAGAGGGLINVGHVEYHGSFSDEERDWFDRRSKRNAELVLKGAIA